MIKMQLLSFSGAGKLFYAKSGGAGTFLMEHNPKSTRGVGGCFLKFSKSIMVLFLSQKKEGVPQNMIIKVHGTFSLPKC